MSPINDPNVPTSSIIDEFIRLSTSLKTRDWPVVECGDDVWTYEQLLQVGRGVAADLLAKHGPRPTVALISENHPFSIAALLAVWMLGGIVAPLDHHAPEALLEGMLKTVEPTCVIYPTSHKAARSAAKDIPVFPIDLQVSTMPMLLSKYLQRSGNDPVTVSVAPDDEALYIFTSSASSPSTLKCVPLTHASVYANCASQLTWLHSAFPGEPFERLRILGCAPFSHIMAISHDIGGNTILTGGCYVFGSIPTGYYQASNTGVPSTDMGAILLDTATRRKTDVFAGVPWIVRLFMRAERSLRSSGDTERREVIVTALRRFKSIISGGAITDEEVREWAVELGVNLVLGIGMTELGGPLFHSRLVTPNDEPGWPLSSLLIPDAACTLVDEQGAESSDGELYVKSKLISRGYRHFQSTAFSVDEHGVITFRTGDLYTVRNGQFVWLGRREDYIQLISGETLDPRISERELNSNAAITRACLVGNNFLRGASDVICALVEPANPEQRANLEAIFEAFASVNRALAPPLRIPWSRVLLLEPGESIPMNRKGLVWRKTLEQQFGERLSTLLSTLPRVPETLSKPRKEDVENIVTVIISQALGIPTKFLEHHYDSTFAELGMDSRIAVKIVNDLNRELGLELPPNACHDHVDLGEMLHAIMTLLSNDASHSAQASGTTHARDNGIDDVVIVGQAFRLPGDISTVEDFWEALLKRREDVLGPVPSERWDHASYYEPDGGGKSGSINFNKAGFIDIANYDNAFFGISSAEAIFVSPSSRLVLETAVEALEDANVPLSIVRGTHLGVFVALTPDDGYGQLLWVERGYETYTRHFGPGVAASAAAGRLSYFLDVHGPSVSIDTACSSGLVALDNAVQYIKSGDGESALVCSVNTHLWPGNFSFLSENQMVSPLGRCATFSREADGYAPSEGVVCFFLKAKKAALRDGDRILGIIRSTATQHNGRSQGLIAPNASAQANLQRKVISKAAMRPADIDFVETHGTGTTLGDLLEIQAINDVFSGTHSFKHPLVIGAAKTVFGHTESSAGLVGVAKSLLSLRYGVVPGLAHLRSIGLNTQLNLARCPLHIPDREKKVSRRETVNGVPVPRRALTLAYGFAGTISGVVLEEPMDNNGDLRDNPEVITATDPASHQEPEQFLFVLSAKTKAALVDYIQSYLVFLDHAQESDLADVCFTTCVGREHYRYRLACVVRTLSELRIRLRDGLVRHFHAVDARPRVIFAFPGQGTQYPGMARDIYHNNAGFRATLRQATAEAEKVLGSNNLPYLLDDAKSAAASGCSKTNQTSIFLFQYAMSRWLQDLGIHPHGVLPHSLGEIAASVSANVMPFSTAVTFIASRAVFMQPQEGQSATMFSVAAALEPINREIASLKLQKNVCVSAYNGPKRHVVSGDEAAIQILAAHLQCQGIKTTRLAVNQAFHSHCIDHALPPIRDWLTKNANNLKIPVIDYYSSVLGDLLPRTDPLGSDYWVDQARKPIRFSEAAERLQRDGATAVLDLGPQPVLSTLLGEITGFDSIATLSMIAKRGKPGDTAFMSAIAALYERGVTPDFSKLLSGRRTVGKKIPIPKYPWQRQRHYPSVIPSRHASTTSTSDHPKPESWRFDHALLDLLHDHTADRTRILPAAGVLCFVAECTERSGSHTIDLRILRPMAVETPNEQVLNFETGAAGAYDVAYAGSTGTPVQICTGKLSPAAAQPQKSPSFDWTSVPHVVMTKKEIYNYLDGGIIWFGPRFQNLLEIRQCETYADGTIEVPTSRGDSSEHKLLRQLDACLHMFGPLAPSKTLPFHIDGETWTDGVFLPSSITGFHLISKSFPDRIICRYYLPLKIEKNFRKMSVSFDIFTLSGKLLASCKAYTVAWIPSNVPFVPSVHQVGRETVAPVSLLRTVWTPEGRPTAQNKLPQRLVYIGPDKQLTRSLHERATTLGMHFVAFQSMPDSAKAHLDQPGFTNCRDVFVYDAILRHETDLFKPTTATQHALSALSFMKTLSTRTKLRRDIPPIVILTQNALPISLNDVDGLDGVLQLSDADLAKDVHHLGGSIVQGMLRVFRHECAATNAWGLDLPTLPAEEITDIIFGEIGAAGNVARSPIAYRHGITDRGTQLVRLVSSLRENLRSNDAASPQRLQGGAVVVGMGDLGSSIAGKLIEVGNEGVVFVGRRVPSHPQIRSSLDKLRASYPHAAISYVSSDVTNFTSIKGALTEAQDFLKIIGTVVHTASVVQDSLLSHTTPSSFEEVLGPKVAGAWNLHKAMRELGVNGPGVRFVLLSSISVPLGNPGQISYVAANAFLDAFACWWKSVHPTAKSVSLQLGAWRSRLTEGMEKGAETIVREVGDTEGMPLVLDAIVGNDGGQKATANSNATEHSNPWPAVQIIAALRREKMQQYSVYTHDPYFTSYLGGVERDAVKGGGVVVGPVLHDEVEDIIRRALRDVLEMSLDEQLDLTEPLASLGVDSIAFTQLRSHVMKRLGVDVPMSFMGDESSIVDIVEFVFPRLGGAQ